jgi:hypothetical protein
MQSLKPLLATVVVLAVNAASNIIPINGRNTGELSQLYPTGFTPPGWVFGIWSLIYLGLLTFSFAAWRGGPRLQTRIASIANPYYLSAFGNAGWILVWHYEFVELSVLFMLLILASLVVIARRLRASSTGSFKEFLVLDGPFSLYVGWITAATLVNLGTLFFDLQWYPFDLTMDQWALVTVSLATGIYVWVGVLTRDTVYCLVFVWAGFGIFVGTPVITEPVRLVAISGATLVALCALWALFSPRPSATR